MKRLTIITLVVGLLAVLSPRAEARDEDDVQRLTIPITNPGSPVSLHISLLSGGISVDGYDGSEVEIEVAAGPPRDHSGRSRGMRRIPNASLGLTVEEENNHVRISSSVTARVSQLRVRVPRRTTMELRTVNDGDISVRDIEGELDLVNTNGAITATGIRGWVVAHTTNGDVRVTFDRIQADKPMSFVTFNGDVDVTFPESLKADLRLKTDRGEIYTDFEFRLREDGPEVQEEREGGRYRVRLERDVRATIGGGGQEISFRTWQGNIYIRKLGSRDR